MIGLYDTDWDSNKNNLYQATGGQFIIVEDGSVPCFADLVEGDTSDINYDANTNTVNVTNVPSNTSGEAYQGKTLRSIFSTVLIVVDEE